MSDLDQLRDDVKREALVASLSVGESLSTAARTAGISDADAYRIAHQLETIELVDARAPDVAALLRADLNDSEDPLAILERGAKTAALKLVQQIEGGDVSASVAKQLIELALKLRSARSDAPPELNVYLPTTHVDPLLQACTEFNALLKSLTGDAEPSSAVDELAPS
jgi:hypothetical protein